MEVFSLRREDTTVGIWSNDKRFNLISNKKRRKFIPSFNVQFECYVKTVLIPSVSSDLVTFSL